MKKLILLLSIILVSITSFSQRYTIEKSTNSGYFLVNDVDYLQGNYIIKYEGSLTVDSLRVFSLYNIYERKDLITSRYFDEVVGVSSWDELIKLFSLLGITRSNDVSLQDQTTQTIIQKFNRIGASTTLKADRAVNDTFITVLDTAGISENTHILIFNPVLLRFTSFEVLSTGGVDTLYIDTPIDVAYDSASFVDLTSTNLAVDGSSTTQTFGLRGVSPSPVGITVDITRIIIHCQTAAAVDLSKFGDIAAGITNGLVLRVRDGSYFNIFNVKTNGELAALGYDLTVLASTNPQQGQDGFLFRLTFASQGKIGVSIRLAPGEDLEFLVRDDLSGITLYEVIAEGHIVEY